MGEDGAGRGCTWVNALVGSEEQDQGSGTPMPIVPETRASTSVRV